MPPAPIPPSTIRAARKLANESRLHEQTLRPAKTHADSGHWRKLSEPPSDAQERNFNMSIFRLSTRYPEIHIKNSHEDEQEPEGVRRKRENGTHYIASEHNKTPQKPILADLRATDQDHGLSRVALAKWRTAGFKTPEKKRTNSPISPTYLPDSPTESESDSHSVDYETTPKGVHRVRRSDVTPQHKRWVRRCQTKGYRWIPVTVWVKQRVDEETGEFISDD